MGRDPERYSEPEKVIPERWMGADAIKLDQFEFPVFQAGPRICVGKDLAFFEAKVCLAELLLRYKFTFADEVPEVLYKVSVTTTFNGNLGLNIQRRE